MKKVIIFLFLISILSSCNEEGATDNSAKNTMLKRRKLIEIGLKYHNPELGIGIDTNAILEKLSDKTVDKIDLKIWEEGLNNYTTMELKYHEAQKKIGCQNLHTEKWINIKKSHTDYLQFEKRNRAALAVCDSLRLKRNAEAHKILEPWMKTLRDLTEEQPKN